ncbi:hypothetical protein EIN_182410 [Entamoeba invadens IP1]|uniref:hypothetical protein n=1 Tax=Entamoeba invadens IP1 TaxID=370355 RepID=UPI0002C3E74B|nr:hypothetical protein EIN_182410 [Entamoeba invadens IP1]ELP94014.1 hypothetical protein EIN_182410 [Entamoeba invadens IP1]|eukprot:XP_004260785.1 hypothetical protein EIN_182410 [Entamoeba invadens IP1]
MEACPLVHPQDQPEAVPVQEPKVDKLHRLLLSHILLGITAALFGLVHLQEAIAVFMGYTSPTATEVVLTTKLVCAALTCLMGFLAYKMRYNTVFAILTGLSLSLYSVFVHENTLLMINSTNQVSFFDMLGAFTWMVYFAVEVFVFDTPKYLMHFHCSLSVYHALVLLFLIFSNQISTLIRLFVSTLLNLSISVIANILALWAFYPSFRGPSHTHSATGQPEKAKSD